MDLDLTLNETRVLGCLIEKQITTPDQYPLSLNALTLACNQKSNREPVLHLSESEVQSVVDDLIKRHLVVERSGFGSRVPKYDHRFCNTEFGELRFSDQELGVLCVLFLRGPQTPGELRTRTQRLCDFADVAQVEATLNALAVDERGPFVIRLAREPGKRESRFAHLLSGPVDVASLPAPGVAGEGAADRIGELEAQVATLVEELAQLRQRLDDAGL